MKKTAVTIQMRLTDRNQFSIAKYLSELNSNPMTKKLSTAEEVELFKMYGSCQCQHEKQKIKDRIITANLRFVVTVAKQFEHRHPKARLEDVIQHGNIGLIKAVDKFNVTVGVKFLTHGGWFIAQEIQNYLENILPDIPQPANRGRIHSAVRRANKNLFDQGIYEPCIDQTVEAYAEIRVTKRNLPDMSVQLLSEIMALEKPFISNSISFKGKSNDESNFTLEDTLKAGSEWQADFSVNMEDKVNTVNTVLSVLPERERQIVEYAYGLNGKEEKNMEQISGIMGYTRERCGQILQIALNILKGQSKVLIYKLIDPADVNLSPFAKLNQFTN